MTYQICARMFWQSGAPLKAFCAACFLVIPTATSATPVASELRLALEAPASRYVQGATDANGSKFHNDGQPGPVHAPGQVHVPDQKIRGVWQRRHTRGLRQKETVSRTPERIPAEGQRDLIDILKPRQN